MHMITSMKAQPSAIRRELKQSRPFPTAEQEAAVALPRTADVIRVDLERALEPFEITPQQYNVLRILRGSHPGSLPTLEIAERMIERAPGITRLLDRIEARGLVARERCREDRRRVLCTVTPAGLELLRKTDALVNQLEVKRIRRLLKGELAKLVGMLDRLREEEA